MRSKDDVTGKTYQGFQCSHCKWIAKYSSCTSGILDHIKYKCNIYKRLVQQQAQTSIDDSTNEMTDVFIDLDSPSLGKRSLSQLTSTTSAPDSVIQVSTKKQLVSIISKSRWQCWSSAWQRFSS
jgi:hypothetical protein